MNLTIEQSFSMPADTNCNQLTVFGVYTTLLFICCFLANSTLLFTFVKIKTLRTPMNGLIAAMTALNWLATMVELPSVTMNAFACKFLTGKIGCYITGFVMYYVGCLDIYLLAVISFERYWVIRRPLNIRFVSFKVCIIAICVCAVFSFLWAVTPLVGWSYYTIEGVGVGCSVQFRSHDINVVSYNVSIFVFVFAIPLITLVVTSVLLVQKVKASKSTVENGTNDINAKRRIKKEAQLTNITLCTILTFVLAWLPYAIMAMYCVFIDSNLSPIVETVPSMFAKTSLLWPAVINLFGNKEVKRQIMNTYMPNKVSAATTGNATDNQRTQDLSNSADL